MRLLTMGSCDVLVGLSTRGLGARRVLLTGRYGMPRDELLTHTAVPGDEHERRRLDQLRDKFAVVVIGRPAYMVARPTGYRQGDTVRDRRPCSRDPRRSTSCASAP